MGRQSSVPFDGYATGAHIEPSGRKGRRFPVVTFIDLSARIKGKPTCRGYGVADTAKDSVACVVPFNVFGLLNIPDADCHGEQHFLFADYHLEYKDGSLLGGMSGTLSVSYTCRWREESSDLPQKVVYHDPEPQGIR